MPEPDRMAPSRDIRFVCWNTGCPKAGGKGLSRNSKRFEEVLLLLLLLLLGLALVARVAQVLEDDDDDDAAEADPHCC